MTALTELEKMVAGELYDSMDEELVRLRDRAQNLTWQYNTLDPANSDEQRRILNELIGEGGETVYINAPFHCDYGQNIKIGKNVFFNFGCVILDVCEVTIGENTMFGPNVQIYGATHPMNAKKRTSGLEFGKPIHIGKEVWIGGGAIICPGVTIGDRAVIGAGSVVTRDIPDDAFAAGNPCRVIRIIDQTEE
jgi:maltose O-acetyltransferase